jgi:cation/acetate symporter
MRRIPIYQPLPLTHPIIGDLFLAFLCSFVFATILAVVSDLVLAASAAIAGLVVGTVAFNGLVMEFVEGRQWRLPSFFA